jgi:hypothetical protein
MPTGCLRHPLYRALGAALTGAALALTGAVAGAPAASAGTVAAKQLAAPVPRWGDTPGATASVNAGEVLLAYTDGNGAVWVDDVISAEDITPVGGTLVDGPAPVYGKGEVRVFGRGTDNRLWMSTRTRQVGGDPDVYSRWEQLGGSLTAKPAAVFTGPTKDDYSVFARGTDAALWQRDHDAAGWKPWRKVGGTLLAGTGPSAAHLVNGETWVLVVGSDYQLWALKLGGRFEPAGGLTNRTPALTAPQGTVPVAYVRGLRDDAAWTRELGGGTVGWHAIGGRFSSGLAATSNEPVSNGAVYQFGLGVNERLWWRHTVYPATGAWESVPG